MVFIVAGQASVSAATATVQWNNNGDHTQAFWTAMAIAGNGGTIIVPASPNGQPWILATSIFVNRTDQTFRLAEGVTITNKAATPGLPNNEQPFASGSLFTVRGAGTSFIGEGSGATLQMRRDEFENPNLYTPSEFRHCISFQGVTDMLIDNLTFRDAGGDGILVTQNYQSGPLYCSGTIRNVICDNNRRNGLSIVSVRGMVVEDCLFTNTIGTNPQAGLDVEPDDHTQFIEDLVIRRCEMINNFRRNIMITSFNFHAPVGETTFNKPFEVLVEDCTCSGSMIEGIYISGTRDVLQDSNGAFLSLAGPVTGGVTIRDTTSDGALSGSLVFNASRVDNYPRTIDNVTIDATDQFEGSPIQMTGFSRQGHGNIQMINGTRVIDSVDRPVIAATEAAKTSGRDGPAISDMTGSLIVESPFVPFVDVGTDIANTPLFDNLLHDLGSGVNLVENPGFESDLAGWTVWNNAAFAVPTRASGQRGVRLEDYNGGLASSPFNVIPGNLYVYSAQTIRYNGSTDLAVVGIRFFDAAGNNIFQEAVEVQSNGSWEQIGDVVTAPSNAVTADIFYWKPVGGPRFTFYGDDFSVSRL